MPTDVHPYYKYEQVLAMLLPELNHLVVAHNGPHFGTWWPVLHNWAASMLAETFAAPRHSVVGDIIIRLNCYSYHHFLELIQWHVDNAALLLANHEHADNNAPARPGH